MIETTQRPARFDWLWTAAMVLLPALTLVLLRGVDTNWDLRNYHLYNPHAWFTGRMLTDIAPAQLQTWHNPMLDVPLYLIAMSGLDSRWTSVWLTLPFAFAIWMLLRLQAVFSPTTPTRASQVVLALLALTGAATYSTIGNSMNDGFVAAAILGSLVLVLTPENTSHRRWLLAGLIAGAMMGLKLTASAYCLALACTALVAGPWQPRLTRIVVLGVGGLLGFLASYGYWGWRLFTLYGNPFFPYYNNFFKSPALGLNDYADDRFRADGFIDALRIPFELLHKSVTHSELYLKDPRLLIGLVGFIALALLVRRQAVPAAPRNRTMMLAVFFVSAFLLWALQYGIYRYAATLELLGSLALVLLLSRLPRGRTLALVTAALLVTIATTRPNWGHVHYKSPMFGIQPAPVKDDAMVIIAGNEPIAFLALGMPRSVPMVAVSNSILRPEECSQMQLRAKRAIEAHAGDFWLLSEDGAAAARGEAILRNHYGMQRAGQCWDYPSSVMTARLCPQKRVAAIKACPTP
jgi:hypothetical protein